MATLRQIQANRRNSERSTGPTTAEGKAKSRANALKHGLTGAGVVMPHDETEAIQLRMIEWKPSYPTDNAEEEWLYREMITQSIRIDRCHEQESALRIDLSFRASLCWNDDRRFAAEDLGDKLARKPARISHQLTRTKSGCEWMIDRWRALDALLEKNGEWTEAQRSLALDLLGTPLELRDPSDDFGSFSNVTETLAFIRERIEDLERRKAEALDPLDQLERDATEQGRPIQTPRDLAQLRRYEAACLSRFQAARNQLRAAHPPDPPPTYAPPVYQAAPIAPVHSIDPIPSPSTPPIRFETVPAPSFNRCRMSPAPSQPSNRQQRRAAESIAARKR